MPQFLPGLKSEVSLRKKVMNYEYVNPPELPKINS
jgi:hypothetical protein